MRTEVEALFNEIVVSGSGPFQRSVLRDPDAVNPSQWDALLAADPVGTLFQGRIWTTAWYRSYADQFEPFLVVVQQSGTLVGIVPLAVERTTRRLAFAGDNMADYRDVLATEDARQETLQALMVAYSGGQFPNVLRVGSTMPESPTQHMAPELARAAGLRVIVRAHAGWRWWSERSTPGDEPWRKKSVRYPINYFRRLGEVRADWIRTRDEWDTFKHEFYLQHSLRQIFGGRPVSFNDPRKRAMCDALFDAGIAHVTALRVGNELAAGHFGCVWDRVLYWGAPSFDIRYKQYSPGLVLVAMTMQQSKEWGLRGFDLTIGEGDLKERFSNEQVVLPMVELYPSRRSHGLAAARDAARKGLRRLTGEERWRSKIRPLLKTADLKLEPHFELGFGHMLRMAARFLLAKLGQRATGLVLLVKPADVREVEPVLATADTCVFHDDQAYDLLKWTGGDPQVAWHITAQARAFADAQRSGRTFHTVLVNDRLAGWGFSYIPSEPAKLNETGGTLFEFLPNSASLYDFYVLPEFRGRKLYPALLAYILKKRFAEGAQQAYIAVLQSNQSSLRAIQRVGFQVIRRNRYMRLARWERTVSSDVPYAG